METTVQPQYVMKKKSPPILVIVILLLLFLLGVGGIAYTYFITPERISSKNISHISEFNPDDPFFQQAALADSNSIEQHYVSNKLNIAFDYNGAKWQLSQLPLNITLINKSKQVNATGLAYETIVVSRFTPKNFESSDLIAAQKYYETNIKIEIQNHKQIKFIKTYTTHIGGKDVFVSDYSYTDYAGNFVYTKDYFWIYLGQGIRLLYSIPGNISTSNEEIERILASIISADSIPVVPPKVKGVSTSQDEGERMVIENKSAVVRIFKRVCGELSNIKLPFPSMNGKKYKYCSAGWGSGFFVNHEGYIATNGHVAIITKEDAVFDSIYSGFSYDFLKDLLRDTLRVKLTQELGSSAKNIPDSTLDQFIDEFVKDKVISNPDALTTIAAGAVEDIKAGSLSAQNLSDETFIQNSQDPILINDKDWSVKNPERFLKAELVGFDYESRLTAKNVDKFSTSDVALLKVKASEYPSVTLGESTNLELGTPIYVIGYPGVSTDISLLDDSSKVQQTITKGIVSAFKEAAGDKKKLIQIDASIAGGNSGGPAFTKEGKVIGIATYKVLTESADFNFLRDIADLKTLMQKYTVTNTAGPVTLFWKEGLDNFAKKYYKRAIVNFKEVQKLYAVHPDVSKFIEQSNTKIAQGEDVTPIFTLLNHDYGKFEATVMEVSIGMMFISGVLLVLVIIRSKRKHNLWGPGSTYTNPSPNIPIPTSYIPPVPPINPPINESNLPSPQPL